LIDAESLLKEKIVGARGALRRPSRAGR